MVACRLSRYLLVIWSTHILEGKDNSQGEWALKRPSSCFDIFFNITHAHPILNTLISSLFLVFLSLPWN